MVNKLKVWKEGLKDDIAEIALNGQGLASHCHI